MINMINGLIVDDYYDLFIIINIKIISISDTPLVKCQQRFTIKLFHNTLTFAPGPLRVLRHIYFSKCKYIY